MDQLDVRIEVFKKKLYDLKEQYLAQKLVIEKLEQENQALQRNLALEKEKYAQELTPYLPDKLFPLQLFENEREKMDLKKRMAQYLDYIDQCISFIEAL